MSLEVNMNTQTKRANPKYTLEFKQDAARLVNEKGYTHQQDVDHTGVFECDWALGQGRTKLCRDVVRKKATLSLSDQSE